MTVNEQMWLVEVRAVAMQLQVALTTTLAQSDQNLASLQHAWHQSVPQSDSDCYHHWRTRARGVTVDSQQQVFEVQLQWSYR